MMSMTRDDFNRAFHEAVELEFADIPTQESEIDFIFSKDFLRKMDNLVALQEDGLWKLLGMVRRHAAVIAIIILGVTISACGINEVITHLYGNVYEEVREEFYAGVTATEIAYEYGISKIPEGFEKVSVSKDAGHVISEYKNDLRDQIIFLQDATAGVKNNIKQETSWDDPEREYVTRTIECIRGLEVELFENKNLIGAMWIEDGYFMEVLYYGCEETEEVIKLVESIQ